VGRRLVPQNTDVYRHELIAIYLRGVARLVSCEKRKAAARFASAAIAWRMKSGGIER